MIIPKLHYIAEGKNSKEILKKIQKACTSGAELIQLNLDTISKKKFLDVAKEAREITAYFQTRLIVKDHYKIAKEVKADGVHFENTDSYSFSVRIHLYTWQIVGGTANNLQECEALLANEFDYITLSPFKNSSSRDKQTKVLGLAGFSTIIDVLKTETPILGFGGITTNDVTSILETGISGVVVSEAISTNFDAVKEFNQLLKASVVDEKRYTF
ncbi:thiamine phosphate synthase [Polaribacter haliotis]|uniref:Thiamine phosphate synthase n=1 Tax=Polaribacter haliotis TaxID=1888915 RepID=A0A7L8AH89_9FLAO|nr:thiamine phosphate synthase [Polaribacter haliotis]QOD61362.1 thiamine phosphate synthase [Polaribacter haliotis]